MMSSRRPTRGRWLAWGGLFASIAACCCLTKNQPTGTIEQTYFATGPWPVTYAPAYACCDSKGNPFDVFYPTPLGANGFRHPVLLWGDGSFAVPKQYKYFLTHLASWGFVVAATTDKSTGTGATILDSLNLMKAEQTKPGGTFQGKLDLMNVGALGHSQGADGVINAITHSGGDIKTVVPIELPAHGWCIINLPTCIDTANVTAGSVFFVDGSADVPISPPVQDPGVAGENSIAAFYDAVPAGVTKLKGTLKCPSHNDIQGQPDCSGASVPCVVGVYGYLGYITAWLMDQLQGNASAHAAFVHGSGEMFNQPRNWEYVDSNIP
jgi:hypothetical protein